MGTDAQMGEVLSMALAKQLTPKVEVHELADAPEIIKKLQNYEVTGRMVVKMP